MRFKHRLQLDVDTLCVGFHELWGRVNEEVGNTIQSLSLNLRGILRLGWLTLSHLLCAYFPNTS